MRPKFNGKMIKLLIREKYQFIFYNLKQKIDKWNINNFKQTV